VTTSPYGLSGADSLPATAVALAAGSAPAPPSAAATLPATGTFSCDSERPRERLRALGPGGGWRCRSCLRFWLGVDRWGGRRSISRTLSPVMWRGPCSAWRGSMCRRWNRCREWGGQRPQVS